MMSFLNPLGALILKNAFSLFATFWVWVTSEALGSRAGRDLKSKTRARFFNPPPVFFYPLNAWKTRWFSVLSMVSLSPFELRALYQPPPPSSKRLPSIIRTHWVRLKPMCPIRGLQLSKACFVPSPPVLGGGTIDPRLVAWPLELGSRSLHPGFVAWPLELGFGTLNQRLVAWPFELGLGTLNRGFVAWLFEVRLGTQNPRCVVWPFELALAPLN